MCYVNPTLCKIREDHELPAPSRYTSLEHTGNSVSRQMTSLDKTRLTDQTTQKSKGAPQQASLLFFLPKCLPKQTTCVKKNIYKKAKNKKYNALFCHKNSVFLHTNIKLQIFSKTTKICYTFNRLFSILSVSKIIFVAMFCDKTQGRLLCKNLHNWACLG